MQDDEIVVSEVHVDSDNIVKNTNDPLLCLVPESLKSRLRVTQSRLHVEWDTCTEMADSGCLALDEDGDLDLARIQRSTQILLDHCPATTLPTVGLQVWKAALVMSDFLLHSGRELLQGKGVVELGGGVGLCGVVAAGFADFVICTDAWEEVLHLCHRNLEQNEAFYDAVNTKQCSTRVRCLDWRDGLPETQIAMGCSGWSVKDLEDFRKADIFLAADVVYDDFLTDCFFELLLKAVTRPEQTVYIALEKRVNFTLEDFDAVSPPHIYFMWWLDRLRSHGWLVSALDLSAVPQYFSGYSRDSYLDVFHHTNARELSEPNPFIGHTKQQSTWDVHGYAGTTSGGKWLCFLRRELCTRDRKLWR